MLNLNTHKFSLGARNTRRRHAQVELRLTSMIDMFTILLVFLLKSYSAEGQIITVSDNLTLPTSTAQKMPTATPIVTVTQEAILLDEEPVASFQDVLNSNSAEIPGLSQRLQTFRNNARTLGERNAAFGFKGEVTIQGDRLIPFRILKKIMATCGKRGYTNIYLAVVKQE